MKKYHLILMIACLGFSSCEDAAAPANGSEGAGIGGSMAQFTILNGMLYTLDGGKIKAYQLAANPAKPTLEGTTLAGNDAETLFPYGDHLYLGSQSGMSIFGLEQPAQPQLLSTYTHITSCDPVIVQENVAYVTLRQGTECRWGQNELHIIDVSSEFNPRLITTYPQLQNPHGLAIRANTLYVCDGAEGLKLIDVSDKANPAYLRGYSGFFAYDAIASPASLIVTGKDGIYQFGYSSEQQLEMLSTLSVHRAN